jgi:hypothetical protein
MHDYTWPSVYFSYLFFALSLGLAVFFFVRSLRDGYFGDEAEEAKYQVFDGGLSDVFESRIPEAEGKEAAVSHG